MILALLLTAVPWQAIAPGIEHAEVGGMHAVRIDPARATISVAALSQSGGESRTAGEWARETGAAVAINAGMFATDHSTHTGYLRLDDHTNNPAWNPYQSVLLLDAHRARIVDRDAVGFDEALEGWSAVVQNLRLIKRPGENVWAKTERKWSEAAVAQDEKGRILFLFSRTPYTMHEFNRRLLAAGLGVVAAQHVEGGPEASLSIRTKKLTLDLAGSFETGFVENEGNVEQWPIPNVLIARPN